MSILVIDVGTSAVRSAVVHPDATVTHEVRRETLPDSPVPGLVEYDATADAEAALACAREVLAAHGPVEAVGISNQRASTIVWDRATGEPVAPAQGWQDLRTVGDCLVLGAEGIRLAPNQSATKLANILDTVDPQRRPRPVLRHAGLVAGVAAHRGRPPRVGPVQRRGVGPAARRRHPLRRRRPGAPGHPGVDAAPHRGLHRRGRRGHRAAGRPTHLRHRRRPAGVAGGPGLRRPRQRQDHLRHRRHARHVPRAATPHVRPAGRRPARSRSSAGVTTTRWSGASRPSCCRPAPTWSGCGTTWA